MKDQMGWLFYSDETMNLFKLKLYAWNVDDAKKYYKSDKFCLDYCIYKNHNKYGCSKKKCPFQHSINLIELTNVKRDSKNVKLVCLYLMYKKAYNDKNPALFNWYADALKKSGTSEQDYLQSEKYFLKSLSIDDNFQSAHSGYAGLLSNKFHNYDKAEYHYNQSLTINPNDAISHANFASFMISKRLKYDEALLHCEKSCKLEPNLSWAHYMKAKSLYKLNRFDESLKEYQLCLKLNKNDSILPPNEIKIAKKQINSLKNKIDEEKISPASRRKKIKIKGDSKREEREFESERMESKNEKEFENETNKYTQERNKGEVERLQQQVDQLVCIFFIICFYYMSNHFFRFVCYEWSIMQ